MNKRHLTWLGIAVALVLAAGLVAVSLSTRPDSVNRTHLDRIQFGMTQAQVEAIFKKPGTPHLGDDGREVFLGGFSHAVRWTGKDSKVKVYWPGEEPCVVVYFNHDSLATAITTNIISDPEPTFLERLLSWLGR